MYLQVHLHVSLPRATTEELSIASSLPYDEAVVVEVGQVDVTLADPEIQHWRYQDLVSH